MVCECKTLARVRVRVRARVRVCLFAFACFFLSDCVCVCVCIFLHVLIEHSGVLASRYLLCPAVPSPVQLCESLEDLQSVNGVLRGEGQAIWTMLGGILGRVRHLTSFHPIVQSNPSFFIFLLSRPSFPPPLPCPPLVSPHLCTEGVG